MLLNGGVVVTVGTIVAVLATARKRNGGKHVVNGDNHNVMQNKK